MVYNPNLVATNGPYGSPISQRHGWVFGHGSSHDGVSHVVPGWSELLMCPERTKRTDSQKDGEVNGGRAPSALNGEASLTASKSSSIQFLHLPSEIRLRIYELLVPRECIFAFRPFYRCKHICTAAKIIPASSARLHKGIDSLVCTNHQIKEEVCSVLYGDNTFVFKIGGENYSQIKLQMNDTFQRQVRAKVFNSGATPLWPLTPDTMKYVRFLTILVQPSSKKGGQDFGQVRESVERATSVVKGAIQLKRLNISLRAPASRWDLPAETDIVVELKPSGGLSAVMSPRTLPPLRRPTLERMQFALEPFMAFYNVKNVTVDGTICPAFAEKLKSVMTSVGPTEFPRAPLPDKRKRALERRRPGYSKRRRVVEYWRPRHVWDTSTPHAMRESTFEDL